MTKPSGFFLVLFCVVAFRAAALDFVVTGGWLFTIDGTDLSGTAGSDLNPTYTSNADAVVIDITGAVDQNDPWRVDINKTDITWDNSLTLRIIRTSDGTGLGTISGGSPLFEVTDTAQPFFTGTGDRSSIQIQLQVDGVSVTLDAQVLSLQVVYTLLQLP